jgi:hypothetical protein
MRNTAFLFFALAMIGSGCYYDSFEGLHPANGYVNPCDTTLQSTYTSAIKVIISYNCLSCHNASYAGGNVNLENYELVKANATKIINSVLRNSGYNPMPPTQSLPDCQTQRLQEWINNNYPQ